MTVLLVLQASILQHGVIKLVIPPGGCRCAGVVACCEWTWRRGRLVCTAGVASRDSDTGGCGTVGGLTVAVSFEI